MKVLLDHNAPHGLRSHFPDALMVVTAQYPGWADLENGALLAATRSDKYQTFATLDLGIAYQQALGDESLRVLFPRLSMKRGVRAKTVQVRAIKAREADVA